MVDFGYVQVIRLLDLVDAKLDDLEDAKSKDYENKRSLPYINNISELANKPEEEEPQNVPSRFDKDIREYQSIRDKMYAELNKLNFRFGFGEGNKNG